MASRAVFLEGDGATGLREFELFGITPDVLKAEPFHPVEEMRASGHNFGLRVFQLLVLGPAVFALRVP